MTINLTSTTDSTEAVTAALGDLAQKPVVDDKKPVETKDQTDPVTDEAIDKPTDEPVSESESEATEPTESETDEESEDLETKTEDEAEVDKPKSKKGGFQRRIDKLNKRNADIEKEKEYWRGEALRVKPADTPVTLTPTQDQSLRPKQTDFATHDEYIEALVDWKSDQKLQAARQKDRDEAVKTEFKTKITTHEARVQSFRDAHDDFDEALTNVAGIHITMAVQDSIIESDVGPQMMYALANDPKEFKRICSLPPLAAAREMGKLEAKFSKPVSKSSNETKTTKAPKPVTPVRTRGATTAKSIYDESLSQRDFEKLRAESNSMRR